MDPINSSTEKESIFQGNIRHASGLLNNPKFESSATALARDILSQLKNNQPALLAWEYIRALTEIMPAGEEQSALVQVISLFAPDKLSNEKFREQIKECDLQGLGKPFLEAVNLFVKTHLVSTIYGTKIGVNVFEHELSSRGLIEHIRNFGNELMTVAKRFDKNNSRDSDQSLDALAAALQYRAVLARYQANYLESCIHRFDKSSKSATKESDREFASKVLHLDFADNCYVRSMANPALPEKFKNLFFGASAVIADVIIPVLEEARLKTPGPNDLPDSRMLHNFHFIVLETIRNYGDLVAGTGPSLKLDKRTAIASLNPSVMKQYVVQRNAALSEIGNKIGAHPFGKTPEGRVLRQIVESLGNAGALFVESVNSQTKEVREFNRLIDVQTNRVVKLMDNKACPAYFKDFFMLCCKSKVPKLPG